MTDSRAPPGRAVPSHQQRGRRPPPNSAAQRSPCPSLLPEIFHRLMQSGRAAGARVHLWGLKWARRPHRPPPILECRHLIGPRSASCRLQLPRPRRPLARGVEPTILAAHLGWPAAAAARDPPRARGVDPSQSLFPSPAAPDGRRPGPHKRLGGGAGAVRLSSSPLPQPPWPPAVSLSPPISPTPAVECPAGCHPPPSLPPYRCFSPLPTLPSNF